MKRAIDIEFCAFLYAEGISSSDWHTMDFGYQRIWRIGDLLGKEALDEIKEEVFEEFSKRYGPREWEIFLHGDEAETRALEDELHRLHSRCFQNDGVQVCQLDWSWIEQETKNTDKAYAHSVSMKSLMKSGCARWIRGETTMTISREMTVKNRFNEHESPPEVISELSATCLVDATRIARRKPGAKPGNLNSAKTLEYAHNIEDRIDGRSLLAEGFKSHRGRILALFNVEELDELDGIERETVRRLVKRRVIRELAWARVQAAFEEQNIEAFNAEVARFQDAADREERTEARLESLLAKHGAKKVPDLYAYMHERSHQPETEHSKSED